MARRPGRFAEALVTLGLRVLPPGPIRRRYERELFAELDSLPRGRRLRFALGVLATSWSLRDAATGRSTLEGTGSGVVARRRIHWRCFLKHSWRSVTVQDGASWTECRRCGKEGDPPQNTAGSMTQLINWW